MLRLNTSNHSCSGLSCEVWIFGIVFEVTSAERASVDVAGWCKPDADVVFFYFFCSGFADFLYQFFIPGAGKKCSAWPCSCFYTGPWTNTETCRSISCHYVWYAIFWDISHTKSVCTSCVWLAAKEINTVIQAQDIHEFIQSHLSVCNI